MSDKLEIYKMAAGMADQVSSRRMVANGFFLTLNTTLTTVVGFFYDNLSHKRTILMLMSVVGIVIAVTWFYTIRSYKRLNKAKFAVIHKMEEDLPYQYFKDEWELLKTQTAKDEKIRSLRKQWIKLKDRYNEITNVEGTVPILFGLIYAAILTGSIFKLIIK